MGNDDKLDGLSDSRFNADYEDFLSFAEGAMARGEIRNPFIIVIFHSEDIGRHTAYIEIENPGNYEGIIEVRDALEKAGAEFARRGSLPFMSMFCGIGHAEKYGIERIYDLPEISEEMEERMSTGEIIEDSLMTAAMVVDGRKRAGISFFIAPPDGGLVLQKREPITSNTGFLVGEGMDVFDLCIALFIGAARVIVEDE